VDTEDGSRRLTERLGVPVKVEAVPRGYLINHASLVTQPAVFKPRMMSDHRVEARKVINLSGGLIDWWADFTPRLIAQVMIKSVRDFVAKWRIRFLS